MSIFICEKCGHLDNTACGNNYYTALRNKYNISKGEPIEPRFKPQYSYFEDHYCCSDCCSDVEYRDSNRKLSDKINSKFNIKNKSHWSEYGKEKLLELEELHDGSMVNAKEYFESNGI